MKRFWTATVALSMLLTVGGTALADSKEPAELVTPAVRADGTISLEGTIEYKDLEGGFYSVGGWGLIGNDLVYKAAQGQTVIVTGKEFTGMSTRMVRQIEVQEVGRPLASTYKEPLSFTVAGKMLKLDQGPVVENGVLMVPLRAVVEAVGGSVEWVNETRTVNVTLPDRKASFVIGEAKAEMNENGVYYLVRNMLPMTQAPILRNGRTLISAEAVTRILGLTERVDLDESLDIIRQ
ncbi:MAG TPA: stalk domain-containing protein [Symbiobacteriaceae bacterium]|nr:stalk domain-containing protein [Symbiobacteriaceae bacterium]